MKIKLSFLLSLAFIFTSTMITAQIDLGRLGKKAENTVERKIDRKVSKGIDDSIDAAEDGITGKDKKKKNKGSGETKVITKEVVVKEVLPNTFNGEFMMNSSNDAGDNMYKIAQDEYRTAIRPLIIKEPHNLIIYNKQEETVITVNNTSYKGKALKDWMIRDVEEKSKGKNLVTMTKTTETKDIGGYIARRYLAEGEGLEAEIWFTREIDADFSLIVEILGWERYTFSKAYGFPLEIRSTLADGSREIITVDGITENEYDNQLFDVSGYQLIDMTDLEPGK